MGKYEQIAREVRAHVEDAVGEIAHDMTGPGSGFLDEKWAKKIKAAKRRGVRDVTGWLADELYNDPDTLSDLMGDRIHDAVHGDQAEFGKVLDALSADAFPGMKAACESLRRPVS